jgi:hypothetical protein
MASSSALSYASSVSPKKRLPMASFIAAMWRLLHDFTDEDRPLLAKGLAFLKASDTRAAKYKVLIESLEWLQDVIRTKTACQHCAVEPLYTCIGCGVHLCSHTEVELEEAGTGTCLRCFLKQR